MANKIQVLERFGFARRVTNIAQSVFDRNKQPEAQWATVVARDDDGRPTVAIDGGETVTCHSWAAEAYEGNRVTVEVRNHKAYLLTNESRPATDDARAEEVADELGDLKDSTDGEFTQQAAEIRAAAAAARAAKTAADEAQATADATGQYFFHDSNGAHVTTTPNTPTGAFNAVWNTTGLLFRRLSYNIVSLTASALSFYDGDGNDTTNIVSMFGKVLARIGKSTSANVVVSGEGYVDVNYGSTNMAHFGYAAGVNEESGTTTAPYYTMGSRASGSKIGAHSIAEGTNSTASGACSHVEGRGCTASSHFSHAEGWECTASAMYAHAEGYRSTASGRGSHAGGYSSTASATRSFAHGHELLASSASQFVIGAYNVEDSAGRYVEIVGGGNSSARENIHTLDWQGNAVYAGGITAKVLVLKGTSTTQCTINDVSGRMSFTAPNGMTVNGHDIPIVKSGLISNNNGIGTVTAGSYKDVTIPFGYTYSSAPNVVVCFNSDSTAGDFGKCTCSVKSVTTSNFTARIFNGDEKDRAPGLRWIAVGN